MIMHHLSWFVEFMHTYHNIISDGNRWLGRGPAGTPDLRGQMARGGGRAEPLLTKRNSYCHLPQESTCLCLTDVRMSRSFGHNLSLRTGIGTLADIRMLFFSLYLSGRHASFRASGWVVCCCMPASHAFVLVSYLPIAIAIAHRISSLSLSTSISISTMM